MMTKQKTIAALALALLPALALATGTHDRSHGTPAKPASGGHDMNAMHKEMHQSKAGKPGDPAKVSRTIKITMDDDMRFDPGTLDVKAGETVRLFVVNKGKLPHELVIGTLDEMNAHAEEMRSMPHMKHNDPNMIALAAGKRGGIVWQFGQAGSVSYACLEPGHREAGMEGQVKIQ